MAHRFRLARYGPGGLETSIDLITSPWKLIDRSWSTETCKPSVKYDRTTFGHQPSFQYYDYVIESFSVIATDSVADLLYQLKRLEDVLEDVRQYHDRKPTARQWWLEWHVDGEEERRALLYTGQMEYPSLVGISPMIECTTIIVKFTLVRHPLWENDTSVVVTDTMTQMTETIHTTDKILLTNVEGTAPARIKQMEVYVNATPFGLPPQTYEYWVGIRPTHDGVANFDYLWECERGTASTDTAVTHPAWASAGGAMTTTFVTTSLAKRFHVQLEDVATIMGNEADYVGRYLVLARLQVSAAGTIGVQMRSGYSDQIVHEEIYVSSTSPYLYELGEIELPPASDPDLSYQSWLRSFMISIYAEQLTAGVNLDVDCLCLIPSEHFIHVSNSVIAYSVAGAARDQVYTMPNDTLFAIGYTRGTPDSVNDALSIIPLDWYIPQENGALILVGQGDTQSYTGEAYSVRLTYYPRWLSYRYDEET